MAIKSRKMISKILVNLEDKRDYILSNEEIKTDNIKSAVILYDKTLDIIHETFDSIIQNKELKTDIYVDKLYSLSDLIDKALEEFENG